MADDNGQEKHTPKTFTVTLQWVAETNQLQISVGDEPMEISTLLNLLTAATREVEADWRVAKAMAAAAVAQQQRADAERTHAILDRVSRRH